MRLSHSLLVVGLTGFVSSAAFATMARSADRTSSGKILHIQIAQDQPGEGVLAYDVAGSMAPNSDAYLVPLVWDGRLRFFYTDAIVKARSNSQGAFAAQLVLPADYELIQLHLISGRGRCLDIARCKALLGAFYRAQAWARDLARPDADRRQAPPDRERDVRGR